MRDARVDTWLSRLEMARYREVFAAHAIEWEILPDLREADLEKLGIPLGHRKKLLRAIRNLDDPGAAEALRAHGPNEPRPQTRPTPAERRQLTVMFCDMVGSTALSLKLDPEDMLEVLQRYQRTCAGLVAEFGGSVAQYLGDGILAYFGHPRAHEDDAERAVRAALAIVEAMGPLNAAMDPRRQAKLAVRIGIATGVVVVGNIIGDAGAEERTAIGETPNLAARLQGAAGPNTVVIADATHRLLGGRFEYEALGPWPLAGFSEPQTAWRVIRPSGARSRFEATRRAPLTPLIGREREMGAFLQQWRATQAGHGAVILLSGEPGIGKSRLTVAFEEAISVDQADVTHFSCSPFHRNTALYPVVERLTYAAGLDEAEDDAVRMEKLRAYLSADPHGLAETLPLLAALLSIDGEEPAESAISAQKQKDMTLAALVGRLEAAAEIAPQLVFFEDLQWIDPTSQEFLDMLVERALGNRLLIVATCRPKCTPAWGDRPHVIHITLERLGRRRTEEFVQTILAGKSLPEAVLTQIVAKTGGIPLFVEELTKTVVDSGLMRADEGGYVLDGPLPQRAIPATIHDSLMARLDQQALPKEIAQIGSVIGRRFSYALLAEVTGLPDAILQSSLDRLVASELVFSRGATSPHSTYVFKHALIQDAAYESLLISRRRQLHQRIAEALQGSFPETARNSPELLAHHYTEANEAEPAIGFWQKAAHKAARASAYLEAVNHLQRGLDLLAGMPEGSERDVRELELRLPLATMLIALKGAGSPEVEKTYARALEVCARLPQSPLHFAAFWGWWRISMNFRTGRERAESLLRLAEGLGDPGLVLQAHHSLWATNFMLGDHGECLHHVASGLALYEEHQHASLSSIYGGHDIRVCAEGEAALSLWLTGYGKEALLRVEIAADCARRLAHTGSIAHALDYAIVLNRYRRRPDEVARLADAMIHFAEDRGLADYIGKGRLFRGWAMAILGDAHAGMQDLIDGLAAQRASGTPEDFPVYFDMLAEAFYAAGRYDDGLRQVEEALAVGAKSGIRYWNAELYRRKAALLLAAGEGSMAEVEACLTEALAVARQQGARMLELRAATDLARLWQQQNRRMAARELLLPVYRWFPDPASSEDLRDARDLVAHLE
ncbi:MAG: adenylate/guanylate cyclase domain-containing protein [Rhodospirillales bacterium]